MGRDCPRWNCSSRCEPRLGKSRQASTAAEADLPRQLLELEAKRELQIALALSGGAAAFGEYFAESLGVGRVEADIGCAVATAIGAPIRMVPDIVGFGAELEAKAFVDGDSLE